MGTHDLLLVDEGQSVKNVGLSLKILQDNFPEKKIVAPGSSILNAPMK